MAVDGGPSIVTDELELFLDSANFESYPGEGTLWKDLVGTRDATLVNGPTFSLENAGILDFDGGNTNQGGGNQHATIPHDSYLSSRVFGDSYNFSLCCWVKFNSFHDWTCMINKAEGPWYSNSTSGLWGDDENFIRFVIGTNQEGNPSTTNGGTGPSTRGIAFGPAETNKWYNVVGVVNDVDLKLYINGKREGGSPLISDLTYPRTENTEPITIGKRHIGAAVTHNGPIANIMIYTKALTPEEVLQNYKAFKPRFESTTSPITSTLVQRVDSSEDELFQERP